MKHFLIFIFVFLNTFVSIAAESVIYSVLSDETIQVFIKFSNSGDKIKVKLSQIDQRSKSQWNYRFDLFESFMHPKLTESDAKLSCELLDSNIYTHTLTPESPSSSYEFMISKDALKSGKYSLFGSNESTSLIGLVVRIEDLARSSPALPKACGIILANSQKYEMARANFRFPVVGYVDFVQPFPDRSIFTVYTFLAWSNPPNDRTYDNYLAVHTKKPTSDFLSSDAPTRCNSVGGISRSSGNGKINDTHRFKIGGKDEDLFFASSAKSLVINGFKIDSIVGKSVMLYASKGDRIGCAVIEKFPAIALVGHDWHVAKGDGNPPKGAVKFTQYTPYHSTSFEIVNFAGVSHTNIDKLAENYHIHLFPIPPQKSSLYASPCSAKSVSGHFNPFEITKRQTADAEKFNVSDSSVVNCVRADQSFYEIGDTSAKYCPITKLCKDKKNCSYQATVDGKISFGDNQLMLSGPLSVVGRSFVFHRPDKSSTRWTCSNLTLRSPSVAGVRIALAHFNGSNYAGVKGDITLMQWKFKTGMLSDTFVSINLTYIRSSKNTKDHEWDVHELRNDPRKDPKGYNTGSNYNPFNVSKKIPNMATTQYDKFCKQRSPWRCELGDSSGKSKPYSIGRTGYFVYHDVNLPLYGEYTVLNRSYQIHGENRSSTRIVAANIHLIGEKEGKDFNPPDWKDPDVNNNNRSPSLVKVSFCLLVIQLLFLFRHYFKSYL